MTHTPAEFDAMRDRAEQAPDDLILQYWTWWDKHPLKSNEDARFLVLTGLAEGVSLEETKTWISAVFS